MVELRQSDCIWDKMGVFGQSGCFREKWLYFSGKMVVFGQIDGIRAKVVVFGQKWLYSVILVVLRQRWLYSGKSVFLLGRKFLYSWQSGCILAKVVLFA